MDEQIQTLTNCLGFVRALFIQLAIDRRTRLNLIECAGDKSNDFCLILQTAKCVPLIRRHSSRRRTDYRVVNRQDSVVMRRMISELWRHKIYFLIKLLIFSSTPRRRRRFRSYFKALLTNQKQTHRFHHIFSLRISFFLWSSVERKCKLTIWSTWWCFPMNSSVVGIYRIASGLIVCLHFAHHRNSIRREIDSGAHETRSEPRKRCSVACSR